MTSICSGPLATTVRPAAVNKEAATRMPLSHYHCTFDATTPDSYHTQSTEPAHQTENIIKTGPTEETAARLPIKSELVIIHRPLPAVLKRRPHYPTLTRNFGQSCINFACCSPAVEATATRQDDCMPLLCFTTVPEQESMSVGGNEGCTELAC